MKGRGLAWTRLFSSRRGDERASELPRRVTIENTHRCNLRCPFCLHTLHDGLSPSMSPGLFDALAAELFTEGSEVGLSVTGEPFLSPRFEEECAAIAKSGAHLVTYTNGTRLLEALDMAPFRAAVGGLNVSLDAATEATYAALRPPAPWAKVLGGIRAYDRWRRALADPPSLELVLVLQRRNIDELVRWVDLSDELGADRIATSHLVVHSESMRTESLAESQEGRELGNRSIAAAQARAQAIGLEATFPEPFGDRAAPAGVSEHPREGPTCRLPWTDTWITASGDVYPCCFPDLVPTMGSATKKGFTAIWNGPTYRNWRRALLGPEPPAPCRSCHLARPTNEARFEIVGVEP